MGKKKLHKTGVWLSFLCTVHCLAMPFALTAMPFLGESMIDEAVEHYLIFGSIILATVLLFKDYRLHGQGLPLVIVGLSALFSTIGIFGISHNFETPFVVTGALLMALAYYINWKKSHVACSH